MDDVCGKFNPTKYSTLDLLPAYKNFKTELEDLEVAMKELNFTRTEKPFGGTCQKFGT